MSAVNPELDNFLGVLTKRLQTVPDDDAGALAGTLQDGDAVDLALHTADLDDGLDWLVGTVRTTAQHSFTSRSAWTNELWGHMEGTQYASIY